ncbi:MAG: metal-dependent transcriptional regulator [Actinobacteria bacterium]|nr:metal-dependent transcriptional regulator [Actinomycetota bacterium]
MSDKTLATATIEEYLEAILNMAIEGKRALGARLAERLNVSPPTVTATLQRMMRDRLITTDEKKEVSLTQKGMKLAMSIVRRHRLAERLLTDILKVPWHEAHQEACLLEHGISERIVDRLYEALGKPATCPHGNPIPVDDVLPSIQGVPLDTVAAGTTMIVERISEEANRLPELMEFFDRSMIKPGAIIKVEEVTDYVGTMKVLIDTRPLSLGTKAAALVWVTPSLET